MCRSWWRIKPRFLVACSTSGLLLPFFVPLVFGWYVWCLVLVNKFSLALISVSAIWLPFEVLCVASVKSFRLSRPLFCSPSNLALQLHQHSTIRNIKAASISSFITLLPSFIFFPLATCDRVDRTLFAAPLMINSGAADFASFCFLVRSQYAVVFAFE